VKILAFIPLRYSESGQFWERDLGLIIAALAQLGHEAIFVALGDSHPDQKRRPLLLIDYATAANPDWWMKQNPDAIVINTWSAPRHDAIRRAATSAGCPVIEKLDTDGVKSPRIYPWHSIRRSWVNHDLRHPIRSGLPRKVEAMARFLVTYLLPSLLDKPMVRCMERVPVYAAETPVASARVRRFLRMYDANPMPRVVTVPHPVNTAQMGFSPADSKLNQVIAIGRWDDAVKGWPLLKAVSERFLQNCTEWSLIVAGTGCKTEGKKMEERFSGRFSMIGRVGHEELNKLLRSSKIYMLTSHSETFNIAGAEALCCGCSIVGPAQIPSSAYFAGKNSGTVSYLRNATHMSDALMAEVDEWNNQRRDPERISAQWVAELGAEAVAKRYLEIFSMM
jgi:glycosyltransferase involved in cell wall biosynthesis